MRANLIFKSALFCIVLFYTECMIAQDWANLARYQNENSILMEQPIDSSRIVEQDKKGGNSEVAYHEPQDSQPSKFTPPYLLYFLRECENNIIDKHRCGFCAKRDVCMQLLGMAHQRKR